MSLFGIAKSGDVVGVIKKIWHLLFGYDMPEELATLTAKFSTQEGVILWGAATTFLSEVPTKGLKQAAADGWLQVRDQTPNLALADLEDAMGIQYRAP